MSPTPVIPHQNLFTRLRGSPTGGVGVFAIRDIPAGTPLFAGDEGETTRVSLAEVERIADPELRRVYADFCPIVDGAFVAPLDFNLLTMGWYLNHSDVPNVQASRDLRFRAARPIKAGEELTSDYRTYSQHAERSTRHW